MSPTANRPSQRAEILSTASQLTQSGVAMSLESAARAAGVSKAGLMYHFPTKEELMLAVVDHVLDGYEHALTAFLPAGGLEASGAEERLRAYLEWACGSEFGASDLVMFADPRLRQALTSRWAARIEPWLALSPDLSTARRTALIATRLIADGMWFGIASGTNPLTRPEREAALDLAHRLLDEAS